MRQLIKKIFNLYDETDLEKAKVEEYLKGYEKGKKVGEEEALTKKYTPNDIRKLLGLPNMPTGLTTPEEHEKYLKFGCEIKIIDPDTGRNLVIGEKGFYWINTEGDEDGR